MNIHQQEKSLLYKLKMKDEQKLYEDIENGLVFDGVKSVTNKVIKDSDCVSIYDRHFENIPYEDWLDFCINMRGEIFKGRIIDNVYLEARGGLGVINVKLKETNND